MTENKGLEAARLAPRGEVENNLIIKASKKPQSLRLAINATCFHCFGGTSDSMPDPGWKQQVRECSGIGCPLHSFRPYK